MTMYTVLTVVMVLLVVLNVALLFLGDWSDGCYGEERTFVNFLLVVVNIARIYIEEQQNMPTAITTGLLVLFGFLFLVGFVASWVREG